MFVLLSFFFFFLVYRFLFFFFSFSSRRRHTSLTCDWSSDVCSSDLPAYVAFQLDQVYTLQALFYAQRVGGSASLDKISQMNIWASQTSPFNPLAPPTNAPAASVPITVSSSGIWSRYLLNAPLIGRYFLAQMQQNPTTGRNIGGSELRLGMV